ncbi:MAG: beta-lactamase family protein [Bacteroidota bacterium]|nr:beta-lactamase family protein [Bacteroidota bacterium]
MRYFYFLLFAIILFSSCQAPEEKPSVPAIDSTPIIFSQINGALKEQQLDTFFGHRFVEGKFSGCILVAQKGIVLYKKAFGWADHEKKDSLSVTSSFQLASVSKQFTAAAIMLLHQEGKLDYDDTIGKYIPGFFYHGITIRELLTHRAGLDKYTNICDNYYREKGCEPSAFTNDSAIAIMSLLRVRPFWSAGKKFEYSNTGYVILASLVEKISGMPFHQFMSENFFEPLDMKHTWLTTDDREHKEKTKGYFGKWNWWRDNFLDGVTGDKGVFSSVEDLFKWDRALKNGTIIKTGILQDAFKGYSPELDAKRYWNYGFGWRTITFEDGANAAFHNGWWHGFTTTFYRGLSDDVTVIILCNKMNKGIYNIQPVLTILGAHTLPVLEEENIEPDTSPKTDLPKCEIKK